jgi:two-component system LytT family response regulator
MKVVIVEDEPQGLNNLKMLLARNCEDVEVIGTAGDVESALTMFKDPDIQPDVAFLDISLPDGLIFQVLNQLNQAEGIHFEIIFVTAYRDFAIRACEYSSIGYIVKPIDPDELKSAVSRVRAAGRINRMGPRVEMFNHYYNNPNTFAKMSISALDGIHFVNIKDITRLEADDNYTYIFNNSGEKMTVAKTLKNYEQLLSGVNFYRVHKRHLINLNFMNKFLKGEGIVIMDDTTRIEVSRRRRPAFMDLLRRLQGELQ